MREKSRKLTNRMASLGRHTQAESVHMVEVESVRLDDFVAVDLDDRIVAWIDVEGASAMVLQSGREVLARTALVYIEVEQEARWEDQWLDVDVAQFFADLGFVPIARDTQRHNQYNVIFARADLAVDPKVARLAARRYRDVARRGQGLTHRPVRRCGASSRRCPRRGRTGCRRAPGGSAWSPRRPRPRTAPRRRPTSGRRPG